MGFMESYKRLERLCADVLDNGRGVSAYIEEMGRVSGAVLKVPGWNHDLQMLKQYRWIRNQIAHDAACDENNMCSEEDVVWLDNFRRRIMEGQDPLALYRKATQPAPKPATSKTPVRNTSAAPSKISDKPATPKIPVRNTSAAPSKISDKPTTPKTPVRNTSAAPSKISDKPAKEKQSWTLIILKLILVGLLVMLVGAIVGLIRSL